MSEEEIWNMILAAHNDHNDHMNREHAQDKRFEAAKAAMQGILASATSSADRFAVAFNERAIVEASAYYADALLAELERTKNNGTI